MKKNVLLVLKFVLVFSIFISCNKKEELIEPSSSKNQKIKILYRPLSYTGVKNQGEYLSFDTRENFESVVSQITNEEEINHFHKILQHQSKYSENEKYNLEDTLNEDESLNAILSINNLVQIENHIFNLDFEKNTIYALESQNINDINALKSKDTLNPNIKYFSMDYETFDLLDAGLKRTPIVTNEKFFGGFRCGWAPPKNDNYNYTYGGGNYNLKLILRYQRAGIWFTLISKLVNRQRLGFIWLNQRGHILRIDYAHRRHIRCNRHIGWEMSQIENDEININGNTGRSHKVVYRAHSQIRALREYDFQVIFHNFTTGYSSRVHQIKHGY
jgi:hypothetical protein